MRISQQSAHYSLVWLLFLLFDDTASFQPSLSTRSSRRQQHRSAAAVVTASSSGNNEDDPSLLLTKDDNSKTVVQLQQPHTHDDDDSESSPPASSTFEASQRRHSSFCVKGVSPSKAVGLNEAVARVAGVSLEKANNLIEMGAVWARMDTLTQDDVLQQYESSGADADDFYQDFPKAWGHTEENPEDNDMDDDLDEYIAKMQAQRYRRILAPTLLPAGTDLRIYPNPRRFPACYDMDASSLLYQDTTFIVVDKPPMLPTQPDASNYHENCPGCVSDILGPFSDITGNEIKRPLLCHRVDAVVGGCVVLSKDRNGQRVFAEFQRQRKLKKLYLAVTTQEVPVGMHLCWMWAPQSHKGKVGGPPCQLVSHVAPESRRKARQFWTRCILEVVKCKPIDVCATEFYKPATQQHYQSTIRLVTGRKHQVRAQLASLGAPIIGDTLYGPMAGITLGDLQQSEEAMDEALAKCTVPTAPIGLQAHAILFGGIKAQARPPWWVVKDQDSTDSNSETKKK